MRSSDYYRSVLGNMGGPKKNAMVRFGITGEGIAPNYEVSFENQSKTTFGGRSHKNDPGLADTFNEDNLSQYYSYNEVQGLLKNALNNK